MRLDSLIKLQTVIKEWLIQHDIVPFSVYITLSVPEYSQGLCSIGFYRKEDLSNFLNLVEYSVQCSKSDYIIVEESITLLITGLALINLYNSLGT